MDSQNVSAALIKATKKGKIKKVHKLLKIPGIDVNYRDRSHKETALMFAARLGHIEIALALLSAGADINLVDNLGQTALWKATGSLELYDLHYNVAGSNIIAAPMVRVLLDAGAEVNCPDFDGNTPLINAIGNYDDIVDLLLAVPGIDVTSRAADKWTPLMCAKEHRNSKIIQKLIALGATHETQEYVVHE